MPPAIILAAGKATRMKPYSSEMPKALFELTPNITVLDLTIRWLKEEGIEEIIVVTRPSLSRFFLERYGEEVRVITTDREEGFGNLYSMFTGMREVNSPEYLVLMSDHIFELEILRRMLKEGGKRAFTLSLDRNPPWDKLEEGLKVVLEEGEVKEVGKGAIPQYGIDTGIFYCSGKAQDIVEETIDELGPAATISDALRRAISQREISYVDVTGLLWMDVDTPEELEEARKILPSILRRSLVKPGDGPISRYVNRPISTRISVYMFMKGIYVSPNIISAISFLLMVISGFMIYWNLLIPAAILIQLSSIIDGMDGEIARLFQTASKFGGLLDSFLDRYSDLIVIGAMGATLSFTTSWQVMIYTVAAGNVFITSYVSHLAGWRSEKVLRAREWSPAGRDVRLLTAAILTPFSLFWPFIWYMAVIPLAFSLYMLIEARSPRKPLKLEKRKPYPEVKVKRVKRKITPLEANIKILLSSSVKLLLWILVLRLVYHMFADIGNIKLLDFSIQPYSLFYLAELIGVIYFGYRILLSTKFLLDSLSKWLAREMYLVTEVAVRRALADIFYLVFLSLLMWFVPNYLEALPLGGIFSKAILAGFLFLFFIFFYDLAKLFYRSFKGFFDRQIARIAEKISAMTEESSKEVESD